jgi:hypothetical protein
LELQQTRNGILSQAEYAYECRLSRFDRAAFMVTINAKLARRGGTAMRGHDRYWLDYDTVAFAVLVIGLGVVELLAWSI